MKKKIVFGMVSVMLAATLLLTGCCGGSTPSSSGNDTATGSGDAATDSGDAVTDNTAASDGKDYYVPGDVVEADGLTITYLSCGDYYSDNEFIQPAEGNKYVYLEFTVENTASYDQYVSYFDFECYADGTYCDALYLEDALSAELSSGRNTTGKVYFEVPAGAASIEIEYDAGLFTSDKLIFVVQ